MHSSQKMWLQPSRTAAAEQRGRERSVQLELVRGGAVAPARRRCGCSPAAPPQLSSEDVSAQYSWNWCVVEPSRQVGASATLARHSGHVCSRSSHAAMHSSQKMWLQPSRAAAAEQRGRERSVQLELVRGGAVAPAGTGAWWSRRARWARRPPWRGTAGTCARGPATRRCTARRRCGCSPAAPPQLSSEDVSAQYSWNWCVVEPSRQVGASATLARHSGHVCSRSSHAAMHSSQKMWLQPSRAAAAEQRGRERSVQLELVRGGAVAPGGRVGHLGAAQRARVLAVQPRGDAQLAEDVAAAQPHRRS
ncbi:hypothetical protein ACJJTC_014793 [Scirpophaga incertulas]